MCLLNNNLRFLRDRYGKKQTEIAKYLNLSDEVYCNYENEKYLIPLKYLLLLSDFYDVSLDYIFSFIKFEADKKNYNTAKKGYNLEKMGERIKELRKKQQMTQYKYAKDICKSCTISDLENHRYLISTKTLNKICNEYKISADYLLGKIDYQPQLDFSNKNDKQG